MHQDQTTEDASLADLVVKQLERSTLSDELEAAVRLAEQYSYITPQPYMLPLNTLAGATPHSYFRQTPAEHNRRSR